MNVARRRTRLAAVLALGFGMCGRVGSLRAAEPDRFALIWQRDEGAASCVDGARLARSLEQVVGPVLVPQPQATLFITGRASPRSPAGFRIALWVRDAQGTLFGERELETSAADCGELDPALLLVLAMLIDTSHVDVAPLRTLRAAPAAPAVETPAPRAALELSSFLSAGFGAGVLPGSSFGLGAGIALTRGRRWSFLAEALYWFPRTTPLTSPFVFGEGVEFSAAQGLWSLCRRMLAAPDIAVSACAGGVLGYRWVNADALGNARNPSRLYFGPALAVNVEWFPAEELFVRLGAAGFWSPRRARFVYADHQGQEHELFAAPALAGWLFASAGAVL